MTYTITFKIQYLLKAIFNNTMQVLDAKLNQEKNNQLL